MPRLNTQSQTLTAIVVMAYCVASAAGATITGFVASSSMVPNYEVRGGGSAALQAWTEVY